MSFSNLIPNTEVTNVTSLRADNASLSEIKLLRNFVITKFSSESEECKNYFVSLDRNPTTKSPAVIYGKIAEAREYTNRVGSIYMEFMKIYLLATKIHNALIQVRKDEVNKQFRINLETIKPLRSTEEKTRYCESLLPQDVNDRFQESAMLLEESKTNYIYFKARYDFLVNTKEDLLTQLGVIKSMMALGEFKTGLTSTPADFSGYKHHDEGDKFNMNPQDSINDAPSVADSLISDHLVIDIKEGVFNL